MRIIVIGGVAGGMSAATRLRRLDESAEIIVIERSGYVSYANCGLPYFVGGVIEDEDDLLLQTPESLHERFRLDVRVLSEVVSVDADQRTVSVRSVSTDEAYDLSYDYLILSPGATPVVPPLPGIERALPLRTVEDVEALAGRVDTSPRSAVVIGGGFIGIELAENLRHRGIPVTLVEASSQVMAPLDPEMASMVTDELERHGVRVLLNSSVAEVTPTGVLLNTGEAVDGELVVLAIGVRPDTRLALAAGVAIGARGGIAVDEFNRTSNSNIYAIGDAAEKIDAFDGGASLVPLANIANRQGRTVADHIMGLEVAPSTTIGTAIVKVFDVTVAATGMNEKRAIAQGRIFRVIHTHPKSHAGYYPGATQMALKLIVDSASDAILGAQGVGFDGVDKRIDVIATSLKAGLRASELAELELAYAPPYGSAKDPINMLGYIADNLRQGLVNSIQWSEVEDRRNEGYLLIDVRTAEEFVKGSIPGARNIPVDNLREHLEGLRGEQVVVYCQVGQRGHTAARLLADEGVAVVNLDGGYATWRNSPARNQPEVLV